MKKFLTLLICGNLMLSLTACSYSDVFNNKKGKDEDTNVSDNKSSSKVKSEEKKGIEVTIGQNIDYPEHYNIAFESNKFSNTLEPTNPDSYYTYFEPKDAENNTLFLLKTTIKNLGTETLSGDKLPKAKLIYDGKYKYDAQLITEEDNGSELQQYDWYMDIDPLKTKIIWYLVEVPKEVETNSGTSLIMQYNINSKTYDVKIR